MAYDWASARASDASSKNYSLTHPYVSDSDWGSAISGLNHNLSNRANSMLHSIRYKGMTVNLQFNQRGLTPTDLSRMGYAALIKYVTVIANRMVA